MDSTAAVKGMRILQEVFRGSPPEGSGPRVVSRRQESVKKPPIFPVTVAVFYFLFSCRWLLASGFWLLNRGTVSNGGRGHWKAIPNETAHVGN